VARGRSPGAAFPLCSVYWQPSHGALQNLGSGVRVSLASSLICKSMSTLLLGLVKLHFKLREDESITN